MFVRIDDKIGLVPALSGFYYRLPQPQIPHSLFDIVCRKAAQLRQFFHAAGLFIAVIQYVLGEGVIDIYGGKGNGLSVIISASVDIQSHLYRS